MTDEHAADPAGDPAEQAAPAEVIEHGEAVEHGEQASDEPGWWHESTVPDTFAGDPDADQFASALQSAGMPPEVGSALLEWFANDPTHSDFTEKDAQDIGQTRDVLRSVWGDSYASTLASVNRYLTNNWPAHIVNLAFGARLPDGQALLNNTTVLMRLAQLARKAPELPKPTGNLDADIQAIKDAMRADSKRYFADPGIQMRLRDLYAKRLARDKRK